MNKLSEIKFQSPSLSNLFIVLAYKLETQTSNFIIPNNN